MDNTAPSADPVILFDLDGTLVDTLPDLAAAANAFLGENGKAPLSNEAVQAMVGDGLVALAGRVMVAGGLKPDNPAEVAMRALRFRQIYEDLGHGLATVYPGVTDTLQGLRNRGFRLAVCTNKTEAMAREILARFELDAHFATVGGSDSFGARKPDPAHLLGVLDRLNARTGDAIMVGDSGNDVKAAQRCRMRNIVVAYGYGLQGALTAGPDMVVNAFTDLPRVLDDMLTPAPDTA